jgi:lipoate-protein ligase A
MLRYPSEGAREEALALYREKTTPVHTLAPQVSWDDVASAFQYGFGNALQNEFTTGKLSESEWALAQELVEAKYSKLTWRKERISLVSSSDEN